MQKLTADEIALADLAKKPSCKYPSPDAPAAVKDENNPCPFPSIPEAALDYRQRMKRLRRILGPTSIRLDRL